MSDFQRQLDRIEQKLDANTTATTENTLNLREHMRRTALLEENHGKLAARIQPLETHVLMWAGASKTAVAISGALGILAAVGTLVWRLLQ